MTNRILIIGADSQIGNLLFEELPNSLDCKVSGTTRNKATLSSDRCFLDLHNFTPKTIDFSSIDTVIFCASITKIQACEDNWKNCKKINVIQTLKLLEEASNVGCFVIFLSSNAVFDGKKSRNSYDDKVTPVTNYGKSKVLVEQALVNGKKINGCVLRLTKVLFSEQQYIETWTKEVDETGSFSVFMYQTVSFLYGFEVVNAVTKCVIAQTPGMFQIGGQDEQSYLNFAQKLFHKNDDMLNKMNVIDRHLNPERIKFNSLATRLPPI